MLVDLSETLILVTCAPSDVVEDSRPRFAEFLTDSNVKCGKPGHVHLPTFSDVPLPVDLFDRPAQRELVQKI